MSDKTINQLIEALAQGAPDVERLQSTLATAFKQSNENPYWTYYEFDLQNSPFVHGEYRRGKTGNKALLSLMPVVDTLVNENDLALERWGEVQNFRINPRIPPEGTDTFIYRIDNAQVSFQLTHTSRRLRSVVLEWGVTQLEG